MHLEIQIYYLSRGLLFPTRAVWKGAISGEVTLMTLENQGHWAQGEVTLLTVENQAYCAQGEVTLMNLENQAHRIRGEVVQAAVWSWSLHLPDQENHQDPR